ncbi:MAG: hypothetical protein QXR68_05295 [Pyrobaculum sp.]
MPISKVFFDERGEPIARVVEEGGRYVVSIDVFKRVPSPPPDSEVLEIAGRYKIFIKKKPFGRGVCEFVYFQFYGETQLINIKYTGLDEPNIYELLKEGDKEVAKSEENKN